MNKEKIVEIFKEIADKTESGQVIVDFNMSTIASIPFTSVMNYMEFTDKSELEFSYKSHIMAELTPTVLIHSSNVENITLAKVCDDDLFGEFEIKFAGTNGFSVIATISMKENQKFEILKLQE